MLNVENLSYRLNSGRQILSSISFSAEAGSLCAVIGPNGAGKSTLLKLITGLLKPSSGSVSFMGADTLSLSRKESAKRMAYLPQTSNSVPCLVSDAVLLGRKPYISWYPSAADREKSDEVIERLGLSHIRDKSVTELSGGEFQKVLIARALVQNASVLLLDEPVNHLDVKNQIEIMDAAKEITKEEGFATLVVIHDLNLALRYADTVLLLDQGSALYSGDKDGLSEEVLSDAYGINILVRSVDQRSVVMF